jgi:dihydropteroate synthase
MATLDLPDGRRLTLDRPRIMGILNVTPDSFSDGGQWFDAPAAVEHGLAMARQGADVIDVGGESTRPGARRVPAEEQQRRVVEVITPLRAALDRDAPDVAISIDTTRAAVAEAALDAGASILNDVAAGREDPGLFELAARRGAPLIVMHMQGEPATMQQNPRYGDVVAEVCRFLLERAEAAERAGVPAAQVMVDPGIGFGKTREHNLALMANLGQLVETGRPVLLGTSRKRFMGSVCAGADGQAPEPRTLVGATCATTALGVLAGVAMFRVHDVQANRQAADVAWAIRHGANVR